MIHPQYGNPRFISIHNSYNYTLQYGFRRETRGFR
jgi:hypothetical protein